MLVGLVTFGGNVRRPTQHTTIVHSMQEQINVADESEAPELHEVLGVIKDAHLVGEEDTALTVALLQVRGGVIIMYSPSRTGKDAIVDATESIRYDNTIYKWPSSESPTAPFYNADEINQHRVQRFQDLSNLKSHQEDILKRFGEGENADRSVTDVAAPEGEQTETQELVCPDSLIAFVATDNEQLDLNDYPEIRNRAFLIAADGSESQTRDVAEYKAKLDAGLIERNISPTRKMEIQSYVSSIPVDEWDDLKDHDIRSPCSPNLFEQEPIPYKFPEARQDFDRLLEFIGTVALYHHKDRMQVKVGSKNVMLVTPGDVWLAMKIMGEKMILSALNLQEHDRAILTLLQDQKAQLTQAELQQAMRHDGYNLNDRDISRSLKSMRERGYIRVIDSNPNEYTFSEFAAVTDHDGGIDYNQMVEAAKSTIHEMVEPEIADAYVNQFCEGDGLIVKDPFTGERKNITEDDELSEEIESAGDKMEGVFEDEPVYEAADQASENNQSLAAIEASTDGGTDQSESSGNADDDELSGVL